MNLSLSDTSRITFASILFGVAFAITGYLFFVLAIGFYDRGVFAVVGSFCLLASIGATVFLFPFERIIWRCLFVLSILLGLYWAVELLAILFSKHS